MVVVRGQEGMRAYPLIGNLLDFLVSVPLWEGLENLAKRYGRYYSLVDSLNRSIDPWGYRNRPLSSQSPGMEMVVLNTSETISDLLDQRSSIYSCKVRDLQRVHPRWGLVTDRSVTVIYPNG